MAKYTGMVIGATIMPITADFIGRNPAFNVSLGMSSLFGFIAAGMPNFLGVATMSAFIGLTVRFASTLPVYPTNQENRAH